MFKNRRNGKYEFSKILANFEKNGIFFAEICYKILLEAPRLALYYI